MALRLLYSIKDARQSVNEEEKPMQSTAKLQSTSKANSLRSSMSRPGMPAPPPPMPDAGMEATQKEAMPGLRESDERYRAIGTCEAATTAFRATLLKQMGTVRKAKTKKLDRDDKIHEALLKRNGPPLLKQNGDGKEARTRAGNRDEITKASF
eukprot:gene4624-33938_t